LILASDVNMEVEIKRVADFLRHEPLVHFVILAGLLFLASALWSGSAREAIDVDKATQDFLIKQRSDLLLRPLTPEEEKQVVDDFVEQEILLREAKKRGLDSSGIVRRLMTQNMRLFLSSNLTKPTPKELRAFFKKNQKRYESPPTLTLDHVFFADPRQVPEGTLSQLREGADHSIKGDFSSSFARKISAASKGQLVRLFGPNAAREILAITDDDWHGPIASPRGSHFIRVADFNPSTLPTFEEAETWIEGEWTISRQREILDRELEAMRPNYHVIIEPRRAASDG